MHHLGLPFNEGDLQLNMTVFSLGKNTAARYFLKFNKVSAAALKTAGSAHAEAKYTKSRWTEMSEVNHMKKNSFICVLTF